VPGRWTSWCNSDMIRVSYAVCRHRVLSKSGNCKVVQIWWPRSHGNIIVKYQGLTLHGDFCLFITLSVVLLHVRMLKLVQTQQPHERYKLCRCVQVTLSKLSAFYTASYTCSEWQWMANNVLMCHLETAVTHLIQVCSKTPQFIRTRIKSRTRIVVQFVN